MAVLKLVAPTPPDAPDPASLKDDIQAILDPMNECFNSASTQLCHAVGRIDSIVTALTEVARIFDGGVGSDAIDGLRKAASSLLNVREVVKQRSGEITILHDAAREVRTSTAEVLRCLQVLDIYGMNVKITASGLPQFMEFADAMRAKLGQGSRELEGLEHMLVALTKSLHEMSQNDRLLDLECSKVFPQVPDTLMREAGNLQAHQASLGQMARVISATAMAIQTELHAAIAAIQIGDRVRQRFEHIVKGLDLIERALADAALPSHEAGPALAVLAALSVAAATEYSRDTAELSGSLVRLRAQCDKLGELNHGGSGDGDRDMLVRIETSVGEAHVLLRQLDRANSEGMATQDFILRTVDEVNKRARSISMLRLDVQHMAINIGLSCRTAQGVGRPVMVIANEIRTYSDRLDSIADTILGTQRQLSEPCHRLQERSVDNAAASGDLLGTFLATISDCNQKGQVAMALVETEAQELRTNLTSAMSLLEEASSLERSMLRVGETLGHDHAREAGTDHATVNINQGILDQLARTYTMADEREVHNRSIAPAYTPIVTVPPSPTEGFDDDEDDGLF
ncbi:hypothetical protein [Novosphingobium taihuense]|uniref:Methyl-accepting chemotaxis protein n=1 Tax=Novosphingobium taihuense TaxID=260085 RepID=A0A7W7AAP6_9SPHN|nr:hypothetical protein [Novosphingobium taihuense]MBB4613386.1 hypothetical protein [Novosphingobium taihuense]TWH80892.1 hypothetical protein IQ25_03628 [Novosphingobium taihuense]